MQLFNTCFNPKKGMGEKLNIPVYTRKVKAPSKKMASLTATVELYKDFPDIADHYCDAKVCEDRVGLSSPAIDNWDTGFLWNKEAGEIELNEPAPEDNTHGTSTGSEPEYVSLTFEQKIAVAINAPAVELDEVTPEILSDAANQRKCEYPAFIRTHKALTYIQPTLENFSDRLLGNAIRSVDFNEDKGIVSYRRAILDYLGVNGDVEEEDEKEQSSQNTADVLVTDSSEDGKLAEDATGAGEPTQEVGLEDTRAMMSVRDIEICHPLNGLFSGDTGVMGKEEAEGVVTCTGHLISEIFPLLLADIAATEFCLSPDFSDEEIYHVATSVLDAWSDNEARRQIVALDAITELRTELPAPAVIEKPVIKVKPRPEPEEIHAQAVHAITSPGLTYRQQLTIAAIQGLCANPACFGVLDEIAGMAILVASSIDSGVSE